MNRNFLKFLNNQNSVYLKNRMDFDKFYDLLEKYELVWILGKTKETFIDYDYWLHIAKINKCNIDKGFIFEYDVNKGLAFGDSIEKSTEWFEIPPYTVKDFI